MRHMGVAVRYVPRSVSTCPPRGNLVDGLPRAPSFKNVLHSQKNRSPYVLNVFLNFVDFDWSGAI